MNGESNRNEKLTVINHKNEKKKRQNNDNKGLTELGPRAKERPWKQWQQDRLQPSIWWAISVTHVWQRRTRNPWAYPCTSSSHKHSCTLACSLWTTMRCQGQQRTTTEAIISKTLHSDVVGALHRPFPPASQNLQVFGYWKRKSKKSGYYKVVNRLGFCLEQWMGLKIGWVERQSVWIFQKVQREETVVSLLGFWEIKPRETTKWRSF